MEDRLKPVNALLGLVTTGDINPPVLQRAGFLLVGLEVPITGPNGTVVVDALLFHLHDAHLLMCEVKSGANVVEAQADRYGAIDPAAVVQAGHVTLPQRKLPSVEVLYVCLEKHTERIRKGFASMGRTFPMLSVSPRHIALHYPELAGPQLRAVFADPVQLVGPPPSIIPLDHDSPVAVIAPAVRAKLVALLSHRRPQVTISTLAEEVAPYLAIYGARARMGFTRKVKDAVHDLARDFPDTYFLQRHTATTEDLVVLRKTPEDNEPRGRTPAYQRLAGRPRPRKTPVNPDQLDLLSELGWAAEDGDGGEPGSADRDEEDRA